MFLAVVGCCICGIVHAANLPGSIDAGRVEKTLPNMVIPRVSSPIHKTIIAPTIEPPAASKRIVITLRQVDIVGMSVFSTRDIDDIIGPFLNHAITLDSAWILAGQLTERYRNQGYFLTRVTVPQQELADGVLKLQVIEGYIGEVKWNDDKKPMPPVVATIVERLKHYKPLKSAQIESALLLINDVPEIAVRAVLQPLPADTENWGGVQLLLEPIATSKTKGLVRFDNSGSRFLGPNIAYGKVQNDWMPGQRTSLALMSSEPMDELRYVAFQHEMSVIPGGALQLYATHTQARPGDRLSIQNIVSQSNLLGAGFEYYAIRQRQQNLAFKATFESRETNSDILSTPLTRESIRVARANARYEFWDSWRGINGFSTTISHGIPVLGASSSGESHLSRAEATPDFTKMELLLSRTQTIGDSFTLAGKIQGQLASGPLYSAEEFGIGGADLGRAYDNSEITGDQGIGGSLELNYLGLPAWYGIQFAPYMYYDFGVAYNEDLDQLPKESATSAGGGMRFQSDTSLNLTTAIAFPLTHTIRDPLYSENTMSPRFTFGLSYGF